MVSDQSVQNEMNRADNSGNRQQELLHINQAELPGDEAK